jgi:predicted metal-dependent hydrolase
VSEPSPTDARLARAIRLFDAERYHAAHEELEQLWLETSGADSDFYKGLIQAAICLHHWQAGNLDGARRLYAGHRRCLAPYLPRHRGIDVERFLAAMQSALRPVVRAAAGEVVPFPDGSGGPGGSGGSGGTIPRIGECWASDM